MIFPTVEFAVFFPVVLGLSWLLMPRPALWKPFILAISYAFYAAADWRFVVLLVVITLVNQAAAVAASRTEGRQRTAIVISGSGRPSPMSFSSASTCPVKKP